MTDPILRLNSAAGLTLNRRSMLLGLGAVALSRLAFGMPSSTLVWRTFSTPRNTTHFLESGPANGPLMMFLHGWPELSLIWRAQMKAQPDELMQEMSTALCGTVAQLQH